MFNLQIFILIFKFKRYTLLDNDIGKYEFPLAHGLQLRVILGGIASGTVRSIVEVGLFFT